MKFHALILALFIGANLIGQENLVRNNSFEVWEDHFPKYWSVVNSSPDFVKGDVVFYPRISKTEDKQLRKILFDHGSHGLSYVNIVHSEMIQGELKEPLGKDKVYMLEFYINRLPIKSQLDFRKLSVKFSNKQAPEGITPADVTHFEVIHIDEDIAPGSHEWVKVRTEFTAKGGESFFQVSYFGNLLDDYGVNKHLVHFCFDEFYVYEKSTLNIHFAKGDDGLSATAKIVLDSISTNVVLNHHFDVIGYSSSEGDSAFNMALSENRASAVSHYLKKSKKDMSISTYGVGEIFSGQTDTTFQKVEVEIRLERSTAQDLRNDSLASVLSQIENDDQLYREKYEKLRSAENVNEAELTELENLILIQDSINMQKMELIFAVHGYPGLSLVGPDGMNAGFWVLQHAPYDMRMKYEYLILDAASTCEMNFTLLPYFLDRNLLDSGQAQSYGTQAYFDDNTIKYVLFEIANLKEVDNRRKRYFMQPLDQYLEYLNNGGE